MQMRFLMLATARYVICCGRQGVLTSRNADQPYDPYGLRTPPCRRRLRDLPLQPKQSANLPHGFRDASTDATVIRTLWQRHCGDLVGVATGAVSNLAVLDIDAKHAEAHSWWNTPRPVATNANHTDAIRRAALVVSRCAGAAMQRHQ